MSVGKKAPLPALTAREDLHLKQAPLGPCTDQTNLTLDTSANDNIAGIRENYQGADRGQSMTQRVTRRDQQSKSFVGGGGTSTSLAVQLYRSLVAKQTKLAPVFPKKRPSKVLMPLRKASVVHPSVEDQTGAPNQIGNKTAPKDYLTVKQRNTSQMRTAGVILQPLSTSESHVRRNEDEGQNLAGAQNGNQPIRNQKQGLHRTTSSFKQSMLVYLSARTELNHQDMSPDKINKTIQDRLFNRKKTSYDSSSSSALKVRVHKHRITLVDNPNQQRTPKQVQAAHMIQRLRNQRPASMTPLKPSLEQSTTAHLPKHLMTVSKLQDELSQVSSKFSHSNQQPTTETDGHTEEPINNQEQVLVHGSYPQRQSYQGLYGSYYKTFARPRSKKALDQSHQQSQRSLQLLSRQPSSQLERHSSLKRASDTSRKQLQKQASQKNQKKRATSASEMIDIKAKIDELKLKYASNDPSEPKEKVVFHEDNPVSAHPLPSKPRRVATIDPSSKTNKAATIGGLGTIVEAKDERKSDLKSEIYEQRPGASTLQSKLPSGQPQARMHEIQSLVMAQDSSKNLSPVRQELDLMVKQKREVELSALRAFAKVQRRAGNDVGYRRKPSVRHILKGDPYAKSKQTSNLL